MAITPSTYKKYALQGSGDAGWGTVLNDQVITYIDTNMGGILELPVSSGTTTLSETQSRNAILRITGSLLGNVTVETTALGFFFVENLTSNNYTVTIRNTSVGTGVVVPQGTRATLISDSSYGVRIAAGTDASVPSGSQTLFFNASAPTGWTKSTTHNNKALRIVSSSGGGTGGSTEFTSVFAARTIAASNLPDHNVTITDPGHTHTFGFNGAITIDNNQGSSNSRKNFVNANTTTTNSQTTGITAAFGNTARGGAQTTIDFAVQYVDAIICVKD